MLKKLPQRVGTRRGGGRRAAAEKERCSVRPSESARQLVGCPTWGTKLDTATSRTPSYLLFPGRFPLSATGPSTQEQLTMTRSGCQVSSGQSSGLWRQGLIRPGMSSGLLGSGVVCDGLARPPICLGPGSLGLVSPLVWRGGAGAGPCWPVLWSDPGRRGSA